MITGSPHGSHTTPTFKRTLPSRSLGDAAKQSMFDVLKLLRIKKIKPVLKSGED